MNKLKWVVQDNLRKSHDVSKLIDCLEYQGIPWEHIPIIPFDTSPIEGVSEEGLTIFYGSTGMTRRVHETAKWTPGVFFNPERFSFDGAKKGYGSNLVNADSEVLSIQELLARDYKKEDLFFSRPAEDSKIFTGALMYFWEMQEWEKRLTDPQDRMFFDTKIQIATPKVILTEQRNFVVNGVVSTSSYYGHGKMTHEVSPEDLQFAQEMAEIYQPAPVFTLDTCQLEDGTRKVVETNCFNSSGFYWSDVYKLVKDINAFVMKQYG